MFFEHQVQNFQLTLLYTVAMYVAGFLSLFDNFF